MERIDTKWFEESYTDERFAMKEQVNIEGRAGPECSSLVSCSDTIVM